MSILRQLGIVRDQVDRDAITLRKVANDRMAIVIECRNCRRVAGLDVLEMIAKFASVDATLGMIRHKAKCRICGKGNPYVLMHNPGIRGDKAWWPHPPLGRG